MGATSRFALPYPADSDAPDGPTQIQALADATDAALRKAGGQSGKSMVSGAQTTTSATPVFLGTPDRVQNIVVAADSLIFIEFSALCTVAAANGGKAYIYVGNNEVAPLDNLAALAEIAFGDASGNDFRVFTRGTGIAAQNLAAAGGIGNTGVPAPIIRATDTLGGPCMVEAPAGTYDVGIKFSRSAGTVSVKDRRLRVWTQEF